MADISTTEALRALICANTEKLVQEMCESAAHAALVREKDDFYQTINAHSDAECLFLVLCVLFECQLSFRGDSTHCRSVLVYLQNIQRMLRQHSAFSIKGLLSPSNRILINLLMREYSFSADTPRGQFAEMWSHVRLHMRRSDHW